jgi:tRNA-specific 2-thiouridylase
MRVLVAMSGGVDSSTAAALLVSQGHEVVGVSMRVHDASDRARGRSCCAPDDLEDARAAARALDIPFYVANVEEHFGRSVVDPFVDDYLAGITPNPCIACNTDVKFDWLLRRARALGARLATGHYARKERRGGRWVLLAGADPAKDQSYFLHGLGQAALADVLFPVGHLPKARVRELAAAAGLPTAAKAESQEICFVTDGDAGRFVEVRRPGAIRPGEVVTTGGEVLGRHAGVHRYTVGQRRRLGVAADRPRYVVRPAWSSATRARPRASASRWRRSPGSRGSRRRARGASGCGSATATRGLRARSARSPGVPRSSSRSRCAASRRGRRRSSTTATRWSAAAASPGTLDATPPDP